MKKTQLTSDETALEKEIENGEWSPIANMPEEIAQIQALARTALNKNKNINIRLSDFDYKNIKLRAVKEGLPYQTLVSSIIHKYITGQLKTG